MVGSAWIELALAKLGCSQKELALRLAVSPTQISKWKNNEHMSSDMESKLRVISGIGDLDPQFVIWSGSLDSALKWRNIIGVLAELASDNAETGYGTWPLEDEPALLCWKTFHTLRQMGVEIPNLTNVEVSESYDDDEAIELLLQDNCFSAIFNIYKSLNDVYGFFAAYICDLVNDDQLDVAEEGMEIESCLIELAASKIDVQPDFAKRFVKFKFEINQSYEKWLRSVQTAAFKAGVPIRAELFNLIYQSHDALGHEAEAESLGVNKKQIHPDIYMNELLVGMRVIHKILPVIVKKLGITEEEIAFDMTDLSL